MDANKVTLEVLTLLQSKGLAVQVQSSIDLDEEDTLDGNEEGEDHVTSNEPSVIQNGEEDKDHENYHETDNDAMDADDTEEIQSAISVSTSSSSNNSHTPKRLKFQSERVSETADSGNSRPSTSSAVDTNSASTSLTQPTFDMNHLDSSISDRNGIHISVNTAILNRDTIELNNQSRNQTDGSDVINLISIHTDKNLISSVLTIHHKLLSVLNAPISFTDPEARISSALYLFKVKTLEGGYYLESYSKFFHFCSNEVRRRNRVVLLYR